METSGAALASFALAAGLAEIFESAEGAKVDDEPFAAPAADQFAPVAMESRGYSFNEVSDVAGAARPVAGGSAAAPRFMDVDDNVEAESGWDGARSIPPVLEAAS